MLLAATLCAVEPADTTIKLSNVTVTGQQRRNYQMRSSQSAVLVSREFLQQNFAGSLMQTLEGIPGVKAELTWHIDRHWELNTQGEYHFMIRLTDRAGWQQLKAVAIKIK